MSLTPSNVESEHEYMCEVWTGFSEWSQWLREEAVNTALEWEADGWTARIISRKRLG